MTLAQVKSVVRTRLWQSPERARFLTLLTVFLGSYFIPFGHPRVSGAIPEALLLLQDYAREHVLFCLIPAFFIAGAISSFVSQGAVLRYLGGEAKKWVSYTVASLSGGILAVCSCTILPLFSGIYRRGAGIGPAVAFLYAGPAINILAIILTARILGWQLGLARALGAIVFSIIIGMTMAALYNKEDTKRRRAISLPNQEERRSPVQNSLFFLTLVLILIFATWGDSEVPLWSAVFHGKWLLITGLLAFLGYVLTRWFDPQERTTWTQSTWGFAKQILPLLFLGVIIAGLLMGRPGGQGGLIPSHYISRLVGGNSLLANFSASFLGALMYFATLTEIPILQGLLGAGMGEGPALALLLAGPALSLPNMLVIRNVLGTQKTLAFVGLVVIMSTLAGWAYGQFFI